jgi:CRP/FNR family cyclic AMP-dependent transcriptional regulator
MLFYSLFRDHPTQRSLKAGEILFSQGDPSDFMYVLLTGSAEILISGTVVETAGPGTIFGEMSVIDGGIPRSATVVATCDSDFAVVDEKRFNFLVDETPRFAVEVMRVMARRLRLTDQNLPADERP